MKIIAFTGPGGAGKNTAAEALGSEEYLHKIACAIVSNWIFAKDLAGRKLHRGAA